MYAIPIPARSGDEVVRFVRALGSHRYVRSRLHLVHAFAYAAAFGDQAEAASIDEGVAAGYAWATALLAGAKVMGLDVASRDERLHRRATEGEVAVVLGAFWAAGPRGEAARARLRVLLESAEAPLPEHEAFDENVEDDVYPLLVDAGWELLSLSELDPERHKGVIGAFGEPIEFASAKFEEESQLEPPVYLHELPAMGPAELLSATTSDGQLVQELVLWSQGPEPYHDYLVRGLCRAAKLPTASDG